MIRKWLVALFSLAGFALVVPVLADPTPATAVAPAPFHGQMVPLKTPEGQEFQAYRTGPASSSLGILLATSPRGLTDETRRWADHLGDEGYRVAIADLYAGKVFQSEAHGKEAYQALDPVTRDAELGTTLHMLKAPGRKIITMGWGGFGGRQALAAALADPGLVGATVLYADPDRLITDPHVLAKLKGPVLDILFQDARDSGAFRAFEAAMHEARKPFYTHLYPGTVDLADLAGANTARSPQAQAAWDETATFIRDIRQDCRRCVGYYYHRRYYHKRYYRHYKHYKHYYHRRARRRHHPH